MSIRDKAAQLVFVPFYGEALNTGSAEYRKYLRWVRDLRVGGLVLVNRVRDGSVQRAEPRAMAAFLNRVQREARVPLLVASDFERGVSMRVVSETKFPHNMAFAAARDPELSRFAGETTARQARALGVPWILAPVADVNNNPENPVINIRSYSENPEEVAAHVRAFIEGAHSAPDPVLVTVKHFPGQGDTDTDTHLALAVLNADSKRLNAVELAPFRAAIAAGVDSVMAAHIAVPALDSPKIPSTLSRAVLTGLLREKLGFGGLIATDALNMKGITNHWNAAEAAVKAIQAGADVLIMPANPERAIAGIVRAVERGAISRRRLDESVRRILTAKMRVNLHRKKYVDPEAMMDALDRPEDIARVDEIAERAMTLVKNEGSLLPVNAAGTAFVVLRESARGEQGQVFAAEVRKRAPDASLVVLEPGASQAEFDSAIEAVKSARAVVVAAFASVASYRGGAVLAGGYPKLLETLIAGGPPVALIALGNPYLARSFPRVAAYVAAYSPAPPCERAAVRALFGEIPFRGKLPVTIPGVARYGDGL
ncbi:MAG TPA: glycoside hydrolase family 3 N-terminal domain-containing protein [Bryobacteraceae bacterium]|nr:glycoside hydrolase family 3 N-terminal domain-containing protein [Bryobacteraceae bacterium]HPU71135.1 glycoside hydrolase family 3 N-terminal domain-containing protein [Bryobacteraceae bacterium]